jgi:hypothetical protein
MAVSSESHSQAWRCAHSVRWRLLESYALARQEGLASPIGLIADLRHPRAAQVLRQLLLSPSATADQLYAGCVERGALCTALVGSAPALAEELFAHGDEPGTWTALVLQDEEVVLSGTWQELISGVSAKSGTGTGASAGQRGRRR